jgi:GH35 family endo-1,4-beta-xylanase
MKHNKLFIIAAAVLSLASCAEDKFEPFQTAAPEGGQKYEYLNNYAELKNYVNRSTSPGFKLGGALAATDFNRKELAYAMIVSNFNEVVAGNEMKYGSCVTKTGVIDLSTVTNFVNNAVDAGVSVYGHTLVWHEQQGEYPASIIKGEELPPTSGVVEKVVVDNDFTTATGFTTGWRSGDAEARMSFDGALTMTSTEPTANFWDVQYMVASGLTVEKGKEYKLVINMQGDHNGTMRFKVGGWSDAVKEGTFNFSTDREDIEIEFSSPETVSDKFVLFQSGDYVGTYHIYSAKIISKEAAENFIYINQVKNGNMEGTDITNFVGKDGTPETNDYTIEGVGGNFSTHIVEDETEPGNHCIVVHAIDNPANAWDTQFWIYTPNHRWVEGEKYQVKMRVRAAKPAKASTQAHERPSNYIFYSMIGDINFTTEWKEIKVEGTINASQAGTDDKPMYSIALNLNELAEANDYFFDDIEWNIVEKGNVRPYTDEEKKDILTAEMERWIKSMMEACDGKVHAWDLANETVSGGYPDAQNVYALQHAATADNPSGKFYWQDYLGDEDFVRIAAKYARQYGPDDVKLFINDYNLESDWDQNNKLKSLIAWIDRWEADGVTKIDGIGSQMHISCYANPTVQESKKNAIVNMLNLLKAWATAKPGRYVRISELDMGYVDATGKDVMTADMTEEQHLQMKELYKFVVSKYLEIIPAAQQWGICQWCLTDSPANSGWRNGQPTGLWDLNYYRKHTYAGFADGLAGK